MRAILTAGLLAAGLIIIRTIDERRPIQVIDHRTAAGVRAEICDRGHSATLRLPEREYYALRDAAFARAGLPTSMQCHKDDSRPDCFILDHIVPLELCTAADDCNRLDNIQIQTKDGAAAKDRIENEERARFCRGEETREEAVSHFTRSVP
jgi:hypothetical protein